MVDIALDVPQIIGLFSGVILPLVVGFFTSRVTNSSVKAVALAALAVIINILTELGDSIADGSRYDLGTALVAGLGTFLVGVGMHYGLWKPTSVAEKLQEHGPQLGAKHEPTDSTDRTGTSRV